MSKEKLAGILETPKDHLARDVWNVDRTLKKDIKAQLYELITSILPAEQVKHMFIIGSITGFKYSEDSDIDVNVSVKPYTDQIKKTYLTKSINGQLAKGTKRPINFFLSEWRDDTIENYSKVAFGVYSVPLEYWVSSPGNPDEVRDPYDKFKFELILARSEARRFESYAQDWRKDIRELQKMISRSDDPNSAAIRSQKKEIQMGRERLKDIVRNLDEERKMAYSVGWGTPRNSEQNVVFKYIEHGKNEELFKKLREEVDNENLDNARRSQSKKQESGESSS